MGTLESSLDMPYCVKEDSVEAFLQNQQCNVCLSVTVSVKKNRVDNRAFFASSLLLCPITKCLPSLCDIVFIFDPSRSLSSLDFCQLLR